MVWVAWAIQQDSSYAQTLNNVVCARGGAMDANPRNCQFGVNDWLRMQLSDNTQSLVYHNILIH